MINRYSIAHFTGGLLSGLFWGLNPWITVLLTVMFLVYEAWEKWVVHDYGYYEIREYLAGLYMGFILVYTKTFYSRLLP